MNVTSTIPIGPADGATLFVDILPDAFVIHRQDGGLVRVKMHEARHLAEVLMLHASASQQGDMGLYWEDDGNGLWRLWCDDRKNHALVWPAEDGSYFWRVFATYLWRDPGGAYHLVELTDLRRMGAAARRTPGGSMAEGEAGDLESAQEAAETLVRRARAAFLRMEVSG